MYSLIYPDSITWAQIHTGKKSSILILILPLISIFAFIVADSIFTTVNISTTGFWYWLQVGLWAILTHIIIHASENNQIKKNVEKRADEVSKKMVEAKKFIDSLKLDE